MELVRIGDAYREKVFRDTYVYNMSGREKFKEVIQAVPKYRKGELGFIHPLVTECFNGKTEPWKVECDDYSGLGLKGILQEVPFVRDLTRDRYNLPGSYDFDPRNILVCMVANHSVDNNSLYLKLVLRPFYEEELQRGVELSDNVVNNVLSVGNFMLDNGVLEPCKIPIEYIPRKVDSRTLQSSGKF